MNERGISASKLSQISGVGKAAISHYVNGRYCPHNDNAVALAKVLGVNPTWLMGFDVEKNQESALRKTNASRLDILTEDEEILIEMFRNADQTTKEMVSRILKFSKIET